LCCSGTARTSSSATPATDICVSPHRRRFALQYEIGLPTQAERAAILRRYLLRHQADMAALRQAGAQLAGDEGGVELDLLLNRCGTC
jgi:hypothetical protein